MTFVVIAIIRWLLRIGSAGLVGYAVYAAGHEGVAAVRLDQPINWTPVWQALLGAVVAFFTAKGSLLERAWAAISRLLNPPEPEPEPNPAPVSQVEEALALQQHVTRFVANSNLSHKACCDLMCAVDAVVHAAALPPEPTTKAA